MLNVELSNNNEGYRSASISDSITGVIGHLLCEAWSKISFNSLNEISFWSRQKTPNTSRKNPVVLLREVIIQQAL